MNIIILCGGPPKRGRQRHLEIFNGEPLIKKLIDACSIKNTNLNIVVHKNNIKLIDYIKNFDNVCILKVDDEYVKSTINKALSVKGDCILVCGDLINVDRNDILKFINTDYECALCRYMKPWGRNIIGNGIIRRSDIGDCITKISEKSKKKYLSNELWEEAQFYLKSFYPSKKIDTKIWNDMMTHVNYAFFYKIWGNSNINNYNDIGTIYFEKKVYADND